MLGGYLIGLFILRLNEYLWGPWMITFCFTIGLLFSILTKFLQIRLLKDMIIHMFKGEKSDAGVSSFQAFSMALSGRIGTGNIAGTATAIAFGGPGAIFWMCAIALIGASSAFIESTLAQIYKVKKNGQYRGGPAFYIEKGIGWRWYGSVFAIATITATAFLLPGIQANSIALGMDNAFRLQPWVTGTVITVILGFIVIGGVKRIAHVAQIVVPFIGIIYMVCSLGIIIFHIAELPDVLLLIFRSAFNLDATYGGMMGSAIVWGVKRSIYSNEAGQGTGAHAAAAAEVSHPVKQGLVQAFSVYIDTLFICTATAIMILLTGMYNVQPDGSGTTYIVENLPGVDAGPGYTQESIDSVLPGKGAGFVAIALFFFGFPAIMAYYYIAEVNVAYLVKGIPYEIGVFLLKVILLSSSFYGAIRSADLAWALGDVGLGIMVLLNSVALLLLAKPALTALKDYEDQKRKGKDPVFNPVKLGIKNADFWMRR